MTTNTATFGLPKPELTDLVTNGWDAIADLADAMDAQLAAVRAALQAADVAEATARGNGDAARIPLAVIDALGDLLVGTGPDAVARLPKGAAGQQLKVTADGSTIAWETPPATDLSSRVAKAGDSMTGNLAVPQLRLKYGGAGAEMARLAASAAGDVYVESADGAVARPLRAGAVYDTGNRVYSASNPPPAGGAVINQTIRGTLVPTSVQCQTYYASHATGLLVTIPSVVMAKAQVQNLGMGHNGGTSVLQYGVALASATQLAFWLPYNGSGADRMPYELTEWT